MREEREKREEREERTLKMSSRRRADPTPPIETHPPSLSEIFWQKASFDGPVGTTEDVGIIKEVNLGDRQVKYTTGNESLDEWKQDLRDLLLGNPVGTQILVKKWNDNFPDDYTNGGDLNIMINSTLSQTVKKYIVSREMTEEQAVSQGTTGKYDGDDLEEAINKVVDLLDIPLDQIHTKTFFFVNNP